MSHRDNVTPFRPRRPPPKPPRRLFNLQSQRGKAILAQALTLTCFALTFALPAPPWSFVGLAFGIGALAIAATNRHDGMPWARTHHEHALRTIIIAAVGLTLLSLPAVVFGYGPFAIVMFWGRIAFCAWAGLRAIIGVGLALFRRPVPNPHGPLI